MAITHAFTSEKADGGDTTLIRPSNWNAAHTGTYEAFPIGGVFIAVVSTDPNTLLGYGTWSQISQGKVLVGQNGSDTDFDTPEETGGSKTASHTGCSVANHTATATGAASAGSTKQGTSTSTVTIQSHTHQTPVLTHSVTQASDHTIMNPYLVVYIWKRTA